MCGITGWVDFEQDLTGQRAVVEAMTATMACRGPDAAGAFAADPRLPGMIGLLPSPYACAAFLLDVNEWLTEYKVSLV